MRRSARPDRRRSRTPIPTNGHTVSLCRPGTTARIRLTGFNPRWWERISVSHSQAHRAFYTETDWTPTEVAAHAAMRHSRLEPVEIGSPLLRRIRATAGPGPVNSTDLWTTAGGIRLEATDGPPCPTLISLLGDAPCGLGWQVEHKACTCLCDHRHHGCSVDFHLPGSQLRVHYSNLRWGRTLDDRRRADVAELNRAAFAG